MAFNRQTETINFSAALSVCCANYWGIRHGTKDNDTSLPIIINLATSLENQGKDVNALLYWDAGHGADRILKTSSPGLVRLLVIPDKHSI